MGARVLIVKVEFTEGEAETYSVPLSLVEGERAENLLVDAPRSVVTRMFRRGDSAVIAEGLIDPEVCRAFLDVMRGRRTLKGSAGGRLAGKPTPALRAALNGAEPPEPSIFRAEQSNTSVMFGQSLIMKFFRKVESGVNPDLELGLFLGERSPYDNTPSVAGSLEYSADGAAPATLAIVHEFVPNEGDAWQYTLDALGRFYEQALTERVQQGLAPPDGGSTGRPDRARPRADPRSGGRAGRLLHPVGPAARNSASPSCTRRLRPTRWTTASRPSPSPRTISARSTSRCAT